MNSYKILENANECTVTESRLVVAYAQESRITKGHKETLGVTDVFIILTMVVVL